MNKIDESGQVEINECQETRQNKMADQSQLYSFLMNDAVEQQHMIRFVVLAVTSKINDTKQ